MRLFLLDRVDLIKIKFLVFSSPVVKEALTILRLKLYNDPNKVKLGQIGELINQF